MRISFADAHWRMTARTEPRTDRRGLHGIASRGPRETTDVLMPSSIESDGCFRWVRRTTQAQEGKPDTSTRST